MRRRHRTIVTLFLLLAVQLAGAIVPLSQCGESCPEDDGGTTCPPICALCAICTPAQQAIVDRTDVAAPDGSARSVLSARRSAVPSRAVTDIFHVPLFG